MRNNFEKIFAELDGDEIVAMGAAVNGTLEKSDNSITSIKLVEQSTFDFGVIKINEDNVLVYDTIISHSMGCEYLLGFLEQKNLPNSVTKIYLLQSDADRNLELKNSILTDKIKNQTLEIYNYFCFYDQALWFSVFANWRVPAGLFGARSKYLKNKKWFLGGSIDLHTSIISKPKFRQTVLKI